MKNTSGLRPLGHAVLTEPYESQTTSILIPDGVKEREVMVEQRVTVVEAGAEAWKEEKSPRAVPGDRVLVSKFAGHIAIGPADGRRYRVVNDRDIFLQIEDNGDKNG